MTEKQNNVDDSQIKDFLRSKKVLVFDQSASSRKALFDAMKVLGCQSSNLFHANKLENAAAIVKAEKPEIIISEYEIHGQFGLVLLEFAKNFVEEIVFILATTTASEASVAEAAEEDVDGYIVKPFIGDKLQGYLRRALVNKISPPPYIAKINDGKAAFEEKNVDEARTIFEEALKLGEKPSLAHYYLGQVEETVELSDKSLDHYDAGLEFIPNHYKCMVAKFEYLDKAKRPAEAYTAVQDMLMYYPITPQRLGRIIYLAIQTKHFSDVLEYYRVYQDLDHKPEKLQVIVKAALFTCGKFLMKRQEYDEACQQFEKSVLCSKRNPELIGRCVEEMLKAKQAKHADKLLKLFSQQDIITSKYKQLEFRVECFRLTKPAILRLGVRMIEDEEADLYVFQKVISLLEEDGAERLIKKYKDMGNRIYPDHIELPED
ncbi:MAG: hypothetical protein HRT45_15995 [Bdellovibrionales bacterium]|nr:hypothetical protein [Bdellovibrionales bacterium]